MHSKPPTAAPRNPARLAALCALLVSFTGTAAVQIDQVPLNTPNAVPGNLVLVPSMEFPTIITHANDPGVNESSANYSGATAYAGYFNAELCYAYHYDAVEANRYFYPVSAVTSNRSCVGQTGGSPVQRLWSGNFLNWATMQAIDTFRLALTGGYRVHRPADGTPPAGTSEMPNVTYLEKANSDRWPSTSNQPFLRSLTSGANNATPSDYAGTNNNPFRTRVGGLRNQMWFIPRSSSARSNATTVSVDIGDNEDNTAPEPISLPVTNGMQTTSDGDGKAVPYNPVVHQLPNSQTVCPTNYTFSTSAGACRRSSFPDVAPTTWGRDAIYTVSIRVKVCDGTLDTRNICTPYGSYYKPEGLLQKNARSIRYSVFSYLTESGKIRDGGVMRARQKLIGPITAEEQAGSATPYPDRARIADIDNPEWDPATGVFIDNPDATDAAATSSSIGNCGASAPDGSQCVIRYSGVINYINRAGQINTGMSLKRRDNLSELYYAALRYLRGLANISSFSNLAKNNSTDGEGGHLPGTGSLAKYQNADGLPVIEDWYKTGANSAVTQWSGGSPGTDGDPTLYQCQTSVVLGIGDTNTAETNNGEDDANDKSRDATANANGSWRGYTEFTANAGRGNVAGLAYWAHLNDLRTDVPNNPVGGSRMRGQNVSTYWVDVVEGGDLKNAATNQYYNATKFGGYSIPDDDWDANGNALRRDAAWFTNNASAWTSKTQTVATELGAGFTNGNYRLPKTMYLANNGQAMINGLNAAFAQIAANLIGSGASLAANSTRLDTGTTTYQSLYYSGRWTGDLVAYTVNQNTGAINPTPTWKASDALPAHGSRNIKTCNPCTSGASLVNFSTAAGTLSGEQQAALQVPGRTLAEVINYLRGDPSREQRNGGPLRNRVGGDGGPELIGDIVNSQPVYVGAPNPDLYAGRNFTGAGAYAGHASTYRNRAARIWVAANDGMLHAFNTANGAETFAYIPNAVIRSGVRDLTNPAYGSVTTQHKLFNDGELTVADAYVGSDWKTILVGTTGRGPAKAVYALNVTDSNNPTLLWERSANDDLPNAGWIGQIVGKPVIAQTADGVWSAVIGNGYNSGQNKAALLKFDLATGALTALETDTVTDNGLAQPVVWIQDADVQSAIGTTAYAGDLKGQLWDCSLTAGTCVHRFTTQDEQPITAGMLAGKDPDTGKVWVFFGTGRYLEGSDLSDTSVQTWYGLIVQGDGMVTPATTTSDPPLTERSITDEIAATPTSLGARVTEEAQDGDMVGKSGWFISLRYQTSRGERMVTPNQFQGRLLLGTTRIPGQGSNPCNPSGDGWIMAIDPFTGGRPAGTFFDLNGDGEFDADDLVDGNVVTGIGFTSIPNNPIFVGNVMLTSFDNATTSSIATAGSGGEPRRTGWRELVDQ